MSSIRVGSRGPEVRKLQLLLNTQRLPGPQLSPDGSFGLQTLAALKLFQQRNQLEVDGVVGPVTWRALGIELKPNPVVAVEPASNDWLAIAAAELGIREDARAGHHTQRILEYHRTTTLRATQDEIAWCSSFVNWVMKQANREGTNSAAAKSWLKWGTELKDPCPGAITITKKRGADIANGSTSGYHVAFFHSGRHQVFIVRREPERLRANQPIRSREISS